MRSNNKMKKLLLVIAVILTTGTMNAQSDSAVVNMKKYAIERGVFNHLGVSASVGTEGFSVNVATPITQYLELSAGVNLMPGIKVKSTVDLNVPHIGDTDIDGFNIGRMDLDGNLARTTFDVKLNVYPFGENLPLFASAGLSFGGKVVAELSGYSPQVARFHTLFPHISQHVTTHIDRFRLDIDPLGNANGELRTKAVRPYIGIGYGRLISKKKVDFRVELGCQIMGKMKIYQNGVEVPEDVDSHIEREDDLSKMVDNLTVWPVLKVGVVVRIL